MEQLKWISVAIGIFVSSSSLAQKYFGISGGLSSNVLVGSEIDFQKKIYANKMSARTGPTFSLFVKREITARFYWKYEAAYVRKGNVSSNNALWNLNLEYISIPVKVGFQPVNFLNVSNGMQLGIEGGVSYNQVVGGGTKDLANSYSSASNSKVRKSGVGVLFGINLERRLASKRILFFNTTWYHDLIPLLSYETGNATYKAGNQGWLFTAGLLFPMR